MYNEQQIADILKGVIEKFKKSDPQYAQNATQSITNPFSKIENPKKTLADYYPSYGLIVDMMERIRIHSELGYFPEKLFADRSPNQTDKEADYIKKNYKQVTLPYFIDYISTVTRAFSDPNWKVSYGEEEGKYKNAEATFKQYVEGEIKNYVSIENFMRSILPSLKAQDANGVIAVKPHTVYALEQEDGTLLQDDTVLSEPVPYYFSSSQVVAYEEGVFCMAELLEKSEVNFGNIKAKIGKVYEFYDEENIYRITQVGKFVDYSFNIELYYNHQWGKVPVTKLKGIPRIYDNQIVWMSPLLYVTDLLDLVTTTTAAMFLSVNNCVYPYRYVLGDACEFMGVDDQGGKTYCNGGNLINMQNKSIGQCTSCGGTGLKSRISPLGVMIIKAGSGSDEGDSKMTTKPMDYISPDVTTLEFLKKLIAEYYAKAQEILHLNHNSNQVNPGSGDVNKETATQAASGQKALYAFVKTVSDQTFDIYQFVLDAIGWMRYGVDYKPVSIKYPCDFDLSNEIDYIYLIGEVGKYNLPPFILYSLIENYLKILYQDDKDAGDAFKLIVQTDRLLTLSNADIDVKVAKRTAEKWEEILHTSAPAFVQQLSSEYKGEGRFFDQEMSVQSEALIQKAKKVAKSLEDNSQQSNIIKSITDNTGGGQSPSGLDSLGKLPLALQQLGLAVQRADETGNHVLSKELQRKMSELVKEISV